MVNVTVVEFAAKKAVIVEFSVIEAVVVLDCGSEMVPIPWMVHLEKCMPLAGSAFRLNSLSWLKIRSPVRIRPR